MLHDACEAINFEADAAYVATRDRLHADDALLASQSKTNVQSMLNAIAAEGRKYGLELNWAKTLQMHIVATNDLVVRPDGGPIKAVRQAVYLGGMMSCDGKAIMEITRRPGEARDIFNKLAKIWSHAA
eukprot:1269753-Pyramimonas_sp.AAC.1